MKGRVVLDAYLRAYAFRPTRIEPMYHVARFYRENGQYHLGYLFSRAVIDVPYATDILFIEESIYHYELPLEYAICCRQLSKHEEAIQGNDAIIASATAPENVRETARNNRQVCLDAARASARVNL